MRRFLASLAAVFLASTATRAQDYSGTYTTIDSTGGTTTLVLVQSPDGAVTGTLSAEGEIFALTGSLENGSIVGTISSPSGSLYFRGVLDQPKLSVTVFALGPNGEPDYDHGQTLVFAKSGAAPGGVMATAEPRPNLLGASPQMIAPGGNPLGAGGQAGRRGPLYRGGVGGSASSKALASSVAGGSPSSKALASSVAALASSVAGDPRHLKLQRHPRPKLSSRGGGKRS